MVFFYRGSSQLANGNTPAGEVDFAKAIELDPKLAENVEKERARFAGNN